jgi:hypothetical protein
MADRTAMLGLVIATILAYVNSFYATFQFDDRATILEDPRLAGFTAFFGQALHMIRPLLKLTFLIDRRLYDGNSAGYHLLNLLLHCASGLLVFAILSRALRPSWVPFWTALLFLLHPMATETVTYISGRATGLAAFLCLLSLYLFLRATEPGAPRAVFRWWYGGALLSFVMALLAKEVAVTLPCLLLLWHLVFRRGSLRLHVLFWAILFLFLGAAWWHPRYAYLARASLETRPLYDNLLTQANAVCYALSLFLVPSRLNFDHDLPVYHSVTQWPVLLSLALLGTLLAAALWSLRRAPLISFGILWFFICILPTNSLVPRYDILSERNLYLPSMGIYLAVAAVAARLPLSVTRLLCILVALGLLLSTVGRNRIYRNEVAFWSDAVRKSPGKSRIHNNLGYACFEATSARQNLLRAWQSKANANQ